MEQPKRRRHNSIDDNDNNKKKLTIDLDRSSRKSITHFENLSNEIIYEVFEFLDFCHIYEAFFDLNRRLTNLLTLSPLPMFISFSAISKMTFQRYYTNIIVPYQHQIKSLHLSNPFMINRVFSPIGTSFIFTRLKKLSLTDIDPEFLGDLLIHLASFPCLVSLVIKCIYGGRKTNNFYREIFRLSMLKYCKLSYEQNVLHEPLFITTNQLSPIEYLVINHSVHLHEINALLSYVPQLRRLSLEDLKQPLEGQTKLYPIELNHLTHVSLNMKMSFDEFESMVKNLFNQVQVLYISTHGDAMYLDASRWERLILSYMPYLRIFDIAITYLYTKEDITVYMSLIDKFNSLFWVERQWFFEREVSKDSFRRYISLYSTNPYRRKRFTLYEEKERNIDRNNGKSNMASVHYVDIRNEEAIITCINYFPNAVELTILDDFISGNGHSLSTSLNKILPLRQLTKLSIESICFDFPHMIELLSYTPNIHTLTITLWLRCTDLLVIQQSEIFQLVSRTNNIRKLTILDSDRLGEVKFLVTLFPRLQHLAITGSVNNLKLIFHFLLSKNNDSNRSLSSLCMNTHESEIETLRSFIISEKRLAYFSVYIKHNRNNRSVHLWW